MIRQADRRNHPYSDQRLNQQEGFEAYQRLIDNLKEDRPDPTVGRRVLSHLT